MKTTIVPPNPGNLSAFGLLAVDWRTDHMVTKVMHEDAIDLDAVAAIYKALEAQGRATLEKDGIAAEKIALMREADVRYAGQSMEVRVPAPAGAIGAQFVAGLDRRLPRRASENFRLQLCRPAESRGGQFLRLRLRPDRPPEHSGLGQDRRGAEADAAGRFISTASFATRRFSRAARCRRVSRSTGPRSSRNSARPRWSFPASIDRRSARHSDHPRDRLGGRRNFSVR